METFFVASLVVSLCGLSVALLRQHIYVNSTKKWYEAQRYCREYYKDMTTITTVEENHTVVEAGGSSFPYSWIGLHRNITPINSWEWSDGQSTSVFWWKSGEPNNEDGQECCVQIDKFGWMDRKCDSDLPFFCYRILVLVNDSKTWDGALAYCRTHYTGLAHLTYNSRIYVDKTDTNYSQTAAVWGGLRFLNRQWFWVNGEKSESLVSLHSCPAPALRCGAFNFTTNLWENRNCGEKLHFICY